MFSFYEIWDFISPSTSCPLILPPLIRNDDAGNDDDDEEEDHDHDHDGNYNDDDKYHDHDDDLLPPHPPQLSHFPAKMAGGRKCLEMKKGKEY